MRFCTHRAEKVAVRSANESFSIDSAATRPFLADSLRICAIRKPQRFQSRFLRCFSLARSVSEGKTRLEGIPLAHALRSCAFHRSQVFHLRILPRFSLTRCVSEGNACGGGINGKRLVRGANGDFFGTVSAKAQLQNSRVGLHISRGLFGIGGPKAQLQNA